MTDYSKCKIYKIESTLGDKIYVGSTCKKYLSQRFALHKSNYKRWKAGLVYKMSSYDLFDEYGPENCNIVLIEEFSCTSKDLKNAREAHFIKELNCINKNIPGRTVKEWCEENKDKLKKYHKDYNIEYLKENKDKIKEYQKEYHKEYKIEYLKKNKDKLKEYQKEYHKEYYQKTKALKQQKQEENINNELIV